MCPLIMRRPDGKIPVLKDGTLFPAGLCEVAWKHNLTEADLAKLVRDVTGAIGTPITSKDVLFVFMSALAEEVLRTFPRGVPLDEYGSNWFARDQVSGWLAENATGVLRDCLSDLPDGDVWDLRVHVDLAYYGWLRDFWKPLRAEFFDRWYGWLSMPREQGLAAGKKFYETPRGALLYADMLFRGGRAVIDQDLRLARTFSKVIKGLVGPPTDDDRQAIFAAILKRRQEGKPLGWYLAKDGHRFMIDKRGLGRLVIKTLGLRYVTVKHADGTTRRRYRRPQEGERTTLDAPDESGRSLVDKLPAEPLTAETVRTQRELREHVRALQRAVEDDPLAEAELLLRDGACTLEEASRRTGVSVRMLKAAVTSQRLRKRYDRFWDVRQA